MESITKTIQVAVPPSRAFAVWTERIDLWWPKDGHTRSRRTDVQVAFEPVVGGRFFERAPDGEEHDWGRVLMWDPPRGLAYSWFMGSGEATPTEVEVRFEPLGATKTQVTVHHRRAALDPERWERRSKGFARSWVTVIEHYQAWSNQQNPENDQ